MSRLDIYKKQAKQLVRWHREGNYSIGGRIRGLARYQTLTDREALALEFPTFVHGLVLGVQHLFHGIGQAIRAQSDELLKVETGSLYPALHRLVKRGWLDAEWGVSEANQRAKYYRLTPAGKAQLVRESDRWSQLVHAIGRIMNPAPVDHE